MTDTTDARTRLEEFFKRRSDDPDSVRVVDYQLITGGYSRQMSRVWVEESGNRRGYIVRQDPPPGQAIIDTDRATEWEVLSTLHKSGKIPMPAPLWFDPTGEELGSPAIVIEMFDGEALISAGRRRPRAGAEAAHRGSPRSAARWRRSRWRRRPAASTCRPRGTTTSTGASSTGSMPRSKHVDRDPFMRMIASYLRSQPPAAGAARARARRLPGRQRAARRRTATTCSSTGS